MSRVLLSDKNYCDKNSKHIYNSLFYRMARVRITGMLPAEPFSEILRDMKTVRQSRPSISYKQQLFIVIQDQVSNLIRNVRSSRIFDSSFDAASRSFESDFASASANSATGMQKSCTASSIVDLGELKICTSS